MINKHWMDFDIQKMLSKDDKKSSTKHETVEDLFGSTGDKKKNKYASDLNLKVYGDKAEDSYIITLINDLFLAAISKRASDIHIEPTEKEISIRFRIDGSFIHYKTFKKDLKSPIIARIKIMSYLRIDEHRMPQDGKIAYRLF